MTKEIQEWLKNLPTTQVVEGTIPMYHGTPFSEEEYLLEEIVNGKNEIIAREKLKMKLSTIEYPIVLCGHTHIPRSIRVNNHLHIINPGSVGLIAYKDD